MTNFIKFSTNNWLYFFLAVWESDPDYSDFAFYDEIIQDDDGDFYIKGNADGYIDNSVDTIFAEEDLSDEVVYSSGDFDIHVDDYTDYGDWEFLYV